MAIQRVENVNPSVLRQCREQLNLSLDAVAKKMKAIVAIEEGTQFPTFRQLDQLSELYSVPRWVFISDSLPEEYQFNSAPTFRKFAEDKDKSLFENYKIRKLLTEVERIRKFILDLHEEVDESIDSFQPPFKSLEISPKEAARETRKWLQTSEHHDIKGWRKMLEEKSIFIFTTSKYPGWSHIGDNFRGLSVFYPTLPIIIVNASDAKKAQSFTLFHELGHILRGETELDEFEELDYLDSHSSEKWCDEFAGNILMPEKEFSESTNENISEWELGLVKNIAKKFKVSPYACLVRMRQLDIINYENYIEIKKDIDKEYIKIKKDMRDSGSGPARNRSLEVLEEYGRIYARTVFQAYYNQDIGLHRLCKLFNLKRASHALDLEKEL